MRPRIVGVLALVAAPAACSLVVGVDGYAGGGSGAPDAAATETSAPAVGDAGVDVASDAPVDAPPTPCGTNDPTLVFHLPFDEASGTVAEDCSGHRHQGTIVGTGVTRVAGHSGGALAFDGVGGCVLMGLENLVLEPPFTMAAWVGVAEFQQSTGDSRELLAKTTKGGDRGWRFATDGLDTEGRFALKLGQASGTAFTLESPIGQPLSTWVHVAAVYASATEGRLFVGGALAASSSAMPPLIDDPAASIFVGCQAPSAAVLKGTLDDVRLYTRALQASEIAALAR